MTVILVVELGERFPACPAVWEGGSEGERVALQQASCCVHDLNDLLQSCQEDARSVQWFCICLALRSSLTPAKMPS